MQMKRLLLLITLLSSLEFCQMKKTHHHKMFKKGHKKLMKFHTQKLVPSLPIKGTAGPYNEIELQATPLLAPKVPLPPLTNVLPMENGMNNGKHSYKQMMQLLDGFGMTQGQVKAVYNTIDLNKNGNVTDDEWNNFFNTFMVFFQACDADKDNMLSVAAEMATCLATTDIKQLTQFTAYLQPDVALIASLMDVPATGFFTLFDYLFLRRINNAIVNCGDNGIIQPQKMYCVLSITSPRTRHIYTPEERQIYLSAVVLIDGFYYGQVSYLTSQQVIAMAYVYNYFSDYELPYNDGIVEKQDFIRSVQDGMLPYIYNPLVVEQVFEDMESLDFFSLCQTIFGFRQFLQFALPDPVNPAQVQLVGAQFTLLQAKYPARLQYLIKTTDVPLQADIETNSTQYWQLNPNFEDQFLRNFNNLIFLEKKNKVKQVPAAVFTAAAAITFPATGDAIFFNMMNANTNGFATLKAYLRFFRFAAMYLEFDPYTTQALSYDLISKKKKPITLQSMSKGDRFLFDQMIDYLAGKPEFFLNFKQFMSWFFLNKVFTILKNTGHAQTTGMERLLVGFHFLGLRLSKYALNNSIKKYDAQLNESTVLFKQAYLIALTEEIQTERVAFKNGLSANMSKRK